MPLSLTAAHSSRRISKRPQLSRRSTTSPLAEFNRRKPIERSKTKTDVAGDDDGFFEDRLDDRGSVKSLPPDLPMEDLAQTMQYVQSYMFDPMVESGSSTRIAEILNFRKSLPPIVTVPHIHALAQSSTKVEREIAELKRAGILRSLVTPGRGTGGSSIGESLVFLKDIETLLMQEKGLDSELANKFMTFLRAKPTGLNISSSFLTAEIGALMRAGFLISSAQGLNPANGFDRSDTSSSNTLTSISSIAKAASGSLAAVGGREGIRSSSQLEKPSVQNISGTSGEELELRLSLPGTGAYLKLLSAARSHLVSLAMKSKFREIPTYLLRERWDGGISADDPAAKAKKYRGEFTGVPPSRTRKCKQFCGLSFDWTLAECLGAGLIEIFETGNVGQAVRIP